MTALQALRDQGKLESGQKVLITGASGGVGTFAIQIAKSMGAEVTAVCSTRNLEMVLALGADHAIDYTQTEWTQTGDRYDLILDNIGNYSLAQAWTTTTSGSKRCRELSATEGSTLSSARASTSLRHWPTRFIPFDAESPLEEMVAPVLANLMALLRDETIQSFDAEQVASQSVPFLSKMGSGSRQRLLGSVRAIVEEFRVHYLGSELLDRTGSPPSWDKTEALDSKLASTLHSMQIDYVQRKTEGTPLPGERQSERLVSEPELEPVAPDENTAEEG